VIWEWSLSSSCSPDYIRWCTKSRKYHIPRKNVIFSETASKTPEGMSGSLWNHHHSKATTFLHRNYISTFFQLRKNIIIFGAEKKVMDFLILVRFSIVNPCRIYYRKPYQNPKWGKKSKREKIYFFKSIWEIYFWELKKKLDIHIDSENCVLSIYDVYSAF